MLTGDFFSGPRLLLSVVLVLGLFSNSAQSPSGDSPQPSTMGWKIKFDESVPRIHRQECVSGSLWRQTL